MKALDKYLIFDWWRSDLFSGAPTFGLKPFGRLTSDIYLHGATKLSIMAFSITTL